MSPRVMRPPARKGRENAVADVVAMIVLSRSKNAALRGASWARRGAGAVPVRPSITSAPACVEPNRHPPRRGVPQVNERHRQGATGARDDRSMTGKTVAVLGSRGGAGASSFAAALARAAHGQEVKARKSRGRRRRNVVLADLATGAGLDVLLGLEHEPGPRWSELALDAGVDLGTLPEWAGVRVVSRDRRPDDLPAAVRSE